LGEGFSEEKKHLKPLLLLFVSESLGGSTANINNSAHQKWTIHGHRPTYGLKSIIFFRVLEVLFHSPQSERGCRVIPKSIRADLQFVYIVVHIVVYFFIAQTTKNDFQLHSNKTYVSTKIIFAGNSNFLMQSAQSIGVVSPAASRWRI
jgi:hypothetical protein